MDIKLAADDLKSIKQVLDKNDINFFIYFGTCLGIVRDGKLIHYDDDVDVGIIENVSLDKKLKVYEDLMSEGFTVSAITKDNAWAKRNVHASLDFWRVIPDGLEGGYKRIKIDTGMFTKLATIEFNGDVYNMPSNTEEYLKLTYGNWRVPAKTQGRFLLVRDKMDD